MKRSILAILTVGLLIFLAACGNENHEKNNHSDHESSKHASSDKPEALKVALDTPKEVKKGEDVELSAKVTLGKENVDDADEVMFEIVKDDDKETSEMKNAKESKNGVYKLNYTFEEAGNYNITSHVTARDQHTMPNKDITVQ